MDDEQADNWIVGTFVGALLGCGFGFGASTILFKEPLLFPGETILVGAIVFGVLGYLWGEDFIALILGLMSRFW